MDQRLRDLQSEITQVVGRTTQQACEDRAETNADYTRRSIRDYLIPRLESQGETELAEAYRKRLEGDLEAVPRTKELLKKRETEKKISYGGYNLNETE